MKTKQQVFALAKKHNCEIDINVFKHLDYDITIDAPENYGFACGDLPAICINNSFLNDDNSTCNTAKAFWNIAYSELEEELKYLEVNK